VYVGTIDNEDLKTISVFKGASFFEEKKSFKGHYHKRNYEVFLQDLNNDQAKELIIKHNLTSQVFIYNGNGAWKGFNN
jgi:hypothetical protein